MTQQQKRIVKNAERFLTFEECEEMRETVRYEKEKAHAVAAYRRCLEEQIDTMLQADEREAARLRHEYDQWF